MIFVFIFVILTLALPLSAEIYKKGSNNIVSQTGKEIVETKMVSSLVSGFGRAIATLNNFTKGSIMVVVGGALALAVFKILALLLQALLYLME